MSGKIKFLTPEDATVITPEMATEILKKNKGNRPLKPSRVKKHVRRIENGRFMLTQDCIAFNTRGKLINGQNRLSACVLTGKPITVFVVKDLDPKVFAVMDTGDTRTASDTIAVDDKDNENPGELATAVRLLMGRLQGKGLLSGKVDNVEIMSVIQEHPEISESVEFIVKLNNDKDGVLKQLGNLGNFACLHYLMRESGLDKAKSLAKEFFEILANVEEEGKERAPVRLRMKLLSDKKSASPLSRDSKIGVIVKAFLAFADGEKVNKTFECQKGEYPVLGGLDIDPEEIEPEVEESTEPEATEAAPKTKKKKKKKKTVAVAEEPAPSPSDDGPPPESE